MNAKQFQSLLARMAGIPESEADQRMRVLRQAEIVPTGARGRNAPDIEPIHAAFMILSLISRRAVDAGAVAHRAANLQMLNGPIKEGATLGALLAALVLHHGDALIRRVTVSEDGSAAWVLPEPGGATEWLFVEPQAAREIAQSGTNPADYGQSYMGRRFVLGGGSIAQMGLKLSKAVESGWHDGPRINPTLAQILQSA
ncbi:hypothetical protein [Methylobacterium trifolii]|uniref:Uncharacterized protein n=1 Tax=Methylobacterium trifolii TaxID=1003092 RepID=A0ABQ4U0B1_9HYPH|nr:hypothetical protein [Methylobacterium trifolii]GJE60731.1 hypothetical protein MPOCJGCO_2847 [Methylobacterium trifolii]